MTARLVIAFAPLLCGAWLCAADSRTNEPGADFFINPAVHSFEVQLPPKSLAALRATPREYVPGTVRADGQTYTNVGIHLKGVTTFRPVDDEPSLTLNFGKFASGQRFHGLRKIHLNNGKEDPTFLSEAIAAEMFAQAGLPVARVTHARLRLNGRGLGPYVAIEGFTDEFLGRYFKDTRGNLYDGGFRHEITDPLEKLAGHEPDDWADLKKLAAAARTPDLETRWQQLTRTLDTNNFSRYLAMQVLTANWDGYAMYRNNYRIYHDPVSDRLFFIPHGMDQTFVKTFLALLPPRWDGLVAGAFMETSEGQGLYQYELRRLFTSTYHTEALARRVDELGARVRPLIAEQRGEAAAATHDRLVAAMRRRVVQRGEFLTQQLATTNSVSPLRIDPPLRRF